MASEGRFINLELVGERRIRKAFDALAAKLQNKILREEFSKGIKAYRKALKPEIPIGETRKLKFGHQTKSRSRRGRVTTWVRWKDREYFRVRNPDDAFYPAVVYYGKKNQPDNRYMRRAWKSVEKPITRDVVDNVRKRIVQAGEDGGIGPGKA